MRLPTVTDVPIASDRNVRVREWPGTGRPIVLLHGFCDSSEGWATLADSTERPCLAPDLPGFGGSDRVTRPRIGAYAEAIDALLDQLGVESATVVGHSLGGAVAAMLAARNERRAASLALVAPAGFGRIQLASVGRIPIIRQIAGVSVPLIMINPVASSLLYTATLSHHRRPPRELIARAARHARGLLPGATDALEALAVINLSSHRFGARVLRYGGPVHVAWGEHDRLVSARHVEALRGVLPQAQVEIFAGCGHHPQVECPRRLARFVDRACSAEDGPVVPVAAAA